MLELGGFCAIRSRKSGCMGKEAIAGISSLGDRTALGVSGLKVVLNARNHIHPQIRVI